MKRRAFLKKISIATAAATFLPAIGCKKKITKKPNIIFILADDLGYGELGCYGQEKIETPNIDKLAKNGMRFTQHYAGAPVCAPSRCVLMTGKHTGHAYIRGNDEWRERGYNCQRQAHTYYPRHLWRNTEKVWLDNPLVVPGTKLDQGADPYDPKSYAKFNLNQYSPDLMFKEIIKFIEKNQKNPFFLYWATPIPHVPLQAPKRWVDYYVKKFGDEEPYLGEKGYFPHRYPHAAYAAMISYLDEQVGLLVQKLKELGIYNNTIIFFTSDNGPSYAGGTDSEWFDSAKPFRAERGRGKGSVYEGGIRVPMIVSWPGHISPSSETDHISAFYDVLPTLCELTGATTPDDIDGISFLPKLLGRGKQKKHEFLYWEFPAYGGQQAVRMGKWKGIRKNILKGNLEIELYDLENDIQEQKNVASQYPEVVKQIAQIMVREHITPEVQRFKMKALGDI